MISRIILFGISIYQVVFLPILRNVFGITPVCRYAQTCSQYAKEHIMSDGVIKGSYLSVMRLLSCQPVQLC